MCSRLPKIIFANLACLQRSNWKELSAVYIIVDCQREAFDLDVEQAVIQSFPRLNISFFYYSKSQSQQAERLKLPYLYAWMSWCIGIKQATTQTVLIHDYDALILSNTALKRRYDEFQSQSAKVQGISWYTNNGFTSEDQLACTFECFVDVAWLRSFTPIELFNNVGTYRGRYVDYDITLEMQARHLSDEERTISPMSKADSEIVHPSQMIHQYTMFRQNPAKPMPCYSMILLPLFDYLSGDKTAFRKAVNSISLKDSGMVWDNVAISLKHLTEDQLQWGLQQSIQALKAHDVNPFEAFFDYYQTISKVVGCQLEEIQHPYATAAHKHWFSQSKAWYFACLASEC